LLGIGRGLHAPRLLASAQGEIEADGYGPVVVVLVGFGAVVDLPGDFRVRCALFHFPPCVPTPFLKAAAGSQPRPPPSLCQTSTLPEPVRLIPRRLASRSSGLLEEVAVFGVAAPRAAQGAQFVRPVDSLAVAVLQADKLPRRQAGRAGDVAGPVGADSVPKI